MREKETYIVVTFHSTTQAMEMEKKCKQKKIPGRLIPVPGSIAAGCGMCWCTKLEEKELLNQFLKEENLCIQNIKECLI